MAKRQHTKMEAPHSELGDKLKAIDEVKKDLTKRFGDGTLQSLGEALHLQVEAISTGSIGLDIAIGVGGVPRGRIIEIYGPESSGKTTMCLHVIAEAQKKGGLCAFVDMEHALDPTYAAKIGVDTETLYVAQPDTGEQALEITETLVRSGALDVIVVDSVAALVPRAEIEGEMGDSHVGLQARLMSQALRKLSGIVKQSNVVLMFTNQLREKVGIMFGCFTGDAPVMLADGTTDTIRNIVENKRDIEVMSFNTDSNTFELRRIVNWFDNGQADEFLRFTVASYDGSTRSFDCTPNHLLLAEDGYAHADELMIGDKLVSAVPVLQLAGMPVAEAAFEAQAMEILNIETAPQTDDMRRFDIEVEGNHCYLVDGVVVHNSPETTSGGRALKFYASVRLDIRRIQSIKAGNDTIGNRTVVKVKKNKVAPPFKEAEFDIMYNEGVSKVGELIDIGTALGIIEKRGAFFRYNEGLIGQGRENSKEFLKENPAVAEEIEAVIRQQFTLGGVMPLATGGPDDDGGGGYGDD